ncbi:MAG: biotin--[acetyl-CoA-carboxylase] ligase [Phycisphaeraceae bacterium]
MSVPSELEAWQDRLEAAMHQKDDAACVVRIYQQTSSTQDVAKSFAPSKALIIADQQTAGRGRLGRQWVSSPGASILMSFVWPSSDSTLTHDRLSILSGIAVAQVVQQLLPSTTVRLKWPNDVLVEDQKIAGILIEKVGEAFVIGIGLNVTQGSAADPALDLIATYLEAHGPQCDRLVVIERMITALNHAFRTTSPEEMLSSWRGLASLGQTQTFEHNNQRITGEVLDLDPDHGLIVRRDSGEIVTLPAATTSVVK